MKDIGLRIWKDLYKYKWFILGFSIYYIVSHSIWSAYCPMLLITGLPCPGCGMTRAIFFVFTFQFTRAWMMNPFAFLWVVLILLFIFFRYIKGTSFKFFQTLLILTLMLTIGYYIYRMLRVFPSYPPIVYRSNNLLENTFPFYRDLLMRLFKNN